MDWYFNASDDFFADELIAAIKQVKTLLMEKADPSISRSQQEITHELDHLVAKALGNDFAILCRASWPFLFLFI